jgi:hypothetical protein
MPVAHLSDSLLPCHEERLDEAFCEHARLSLRRSSARALGAQRLCDLSQVVEVASDAPCRASRKSARELQALHHFGS